MWLNRNLAGTSPRYPGTVKGLILNDLVPLAGSVRFLGEAEEGDGLPAVGSAYSSEAEQGRVAAHLAQALREPMADGHPVQG